MANTHETIADIIAEKRQYADELESKIIAYKDNPSKDLALESLALSLVAENRNEADRLEAAHRRERGDAAKLREALDESRRIASDLGGCRLNDYWKLNEIVRVCEAALAAPPRNCDLTKVTEDPWRAWLDDTSNWEEGYPKLEIHDWLLAPATEKEGGAK